MTDGRAPTRRGLIKAGAALGAVSLLGVAGCGKDDDRPSPSEATGGAAPTLPSTSGKRVDASSYGAVGDGVTDDTQSLTAAVRAVSDAGGGQVVLSSAADGYLLRALTLPSGVGLVCTDGQATLLKMEASSLWLQSENSANDVTLSNLILQSRGLVQTSVIQARPGTRRMLVDHCALSGGEVNPAIGVECAPGSADLTIKDTSFENFHTCVRVNLAQERVSVADCTMTDWTDRGITVRGTTAGAPRGVFITGNTIGPNAPGGISRQAIAFSNDHGQPLVDVHVRGNKVTGAGIDDKDPSGAGSADLISLHQCRDFEVRDNVVTGSGEVGITVSQGSRDGIIAGNTCTMNDTAGIAIGSSISVGVGSIIVEDNTCTDNGQNYGGSAIGNWAYAGITVFGAEDVTLRRNKLSTTTGKQRFGLTVIGGSDVRVAKDNRISGPVEKRVLHKSSIAGARGP